jgi:hypothetical protein
MNLELAIRYVGFGKRCSGCGRVRETTRYEIRQDDKQVQEFLLCDACQDNGYVIKFQVNRPSVTTKKERKSRIKVSRKLEKGVARDVGGRTTPGSGNRDVKGDIRKIDEWRIEHKYTDSLKGWRLEISTLSTLVHYANLAGEWPALVINFRRLKRQFVTIPYELFIAIVEKLRD